ncbi:MAG: PKD domain-containing protein, partial [Bacteroidota bacterium]
MGFLRTGSSIYPEFRVVTVDDNFNWSSSVQVRSGDDYVDNGSSSTNRWGDYSGISRRHLSSGIEVWIAGCYGDNFNGGGTEVLGTWIAKIGNTSSPSIPVADFSGFPQTLVAGNNVTFSDQSTNNPTSWSWSFGDGTTSSAQNPIKTYTLPGTYTVSLTASNSSGSDTEIKTNYITVQGPAPSANFTASQTTIAAGGSVDFTDLSTNTPTSWSWNFGNGQTSTQQNPQNVVYTNPGTYTVTLTASNSSGSDTETKTNYITVQNPAPNADFIANQTTIIAGGSVNFSDLSTNTPTSWSWNFGNGQTSTQQNPQNVVYVNPGTYTVTLTASNSTGSDTETKTNYITVQTPAPDANFIANQTTIIAGGSVNFTDLSTNTPTSWSWNFGNGQTSAQQNPQNIVYANPGTYTVTLTASNGTGSDIETKMGYITVLVPAPVADFMASSTTIFVGDSVNFTDLSTNTPTSWNWDFGNGQTSSLQNPSNIAYTVPGTYTVSLIVANATGSDIETKMS